MQLPETGPGAVLVRQQGEAAVLLDLPAKGLLALQGAAQMGGGAPPPMHRVGDLGISRAGAQHQVDEPGVLQIGQVAVGIEFIPGADAGPGIHHRPLLGNEHVPQPVAVQGKVLAFEAGADEGRHFPAR